MEFYLTRAMEIARLRQDQVDQLHFHERVKCLVPWEIQEVFGLPPLKETWRIPENDAAQSQHAQDLRHRMREIGIAPKHDLVSMDTDAVHLFDEQVQNAVKNGLSFECVVGSSRKRLREDD